MKNQTNYLILFVVIALVFSSCATILSGARKGIKVTNGTPENARVFYNGEYMGTAPCRVQVQKQFRQGNSKIEIKADGYQTSSITMTRKISVGYTILDICTGGIWLIIDFATGNIYKPRPHKISYYLENGSSAINNRATPNTNPVKKENKTSETKQATKIKTGDYVMWETEFKNTLTGTVIGVNEKKAIVTCDKKNKNISVPLEKLTAIEKPKTQVNTNDKVEYYKVNTDVLNFRTGPGANYDIITTIDQGIIVEVLDKSNATWYKIRYQNKTGYVMSEFLIKN